MFYSDLTTETRPRRYGRWGWTWRTAHQWVCTKCHRHIATAGTFYCPTCGIRLQHVSKLPRKGSKAIKAVALHPRWQTDPDGDYPTARPRRFPGCGAPPKF